MLQGRFSRIFLGIERRLFAIFGTLSTGFLVLSLIFWTVDVARWTKVLLPLTPIQVTEANREAFEAKIATALPVLKFVFLKIGLALGAAGFLGWLACRIQANSKPGPEFGDQWPRFSTDPQASRTRWFDGLAALGLALLVWLQVVGSLSRPLEGDELLNYRAHLTRSFVGLLTTMEGANNQLGFSIPAWISMRIWGDLPESVRWPATLAGMALPALVYLTLRRDHGRLTGLLIGLLLAVWPDLVSAAAQGRSYSLLMVAALWHFNCLRNYWAKPSAKTAVRYALSIVLGCASHFWFIMVAIAEAVLAFIQILDRRYFQSRVLQLPNPPDFRRFSFVLTLAAASAVLVHIGVIHKYVYIMTQRNLEKGGLIDSLTDVGLALGGLSFQLPPFMAPYSDGGERITIDVIVSLLALLGLWSAILATRSSVRVRFDLYGLALLGLTYVGLTTAFRPVYMYPRFFILMPFATLLVSSHGWSRIINRSHEELISRMAAPNHGSPQMGF